MGIVDKKCCCRCAELLGVGTDFEIEIGDRIRVFTTGGIGPEPFQGFLADVEENTIVLTDVHGNDGPEENTQFVRYCCAHITTIELFDPANG